ncbi:MAG: GGDEF domain-containing protein [Rhodanobacteraceae bacterium]
MSTRENESITHRTQLSPGPRRPGQRTACVIVIYGEGLGQRLNVESRQILIGRSEEADLQLPHPSVSRRHCQIWRDGQDHWIRDQGATNRTRLNDRELGDSDHLLVDGDHITVGESILKFIGHASLEAPYHEEVYQLATQDALTELGNRRHFDELLEKELARATRHRRALSLCIIDIDLFKKVNDNHGHIEGDGVLRRIADVIRAHARIEDVAARIGGEEFAVLFPETAVASAHGICERLRQSVRETTFRFGDARQTITVSIGIAGLQDGDTRAALMQRADQALYQAKNNGRDMTCDAP